MTDNVQEIKDKIDIVDYIKSVVALKPAGKNWKGLCPFHKEKTPSFMVAPDRQIWHCFGGCNDGGDLFSFVMKYENVEFYEALKILAEKAGVELKRGSGDFQKYDRLYQINEAAKNFFQQSLTKNSPAYIYIKDRGLTDQTLAEFEIGLAPNNPDSLLRTLTKAGFAIADLEQAGVVFRTERGTYWDRFRNRLMFPLYNSFGKVVGFTGRILDAKTEMAKYVNSPETPIFQKSKFLYGLHKTKNAIRESGMAVLVEGQMDFLMSWQDGLKNAVATSGTALTNDHLLALKRLTDQLVLSFDNDAAGQSAIERSLDLAVTNDFSVKVLMIPGQKDPADIVKQEPGLMIKLVQQAQPAMNFYFNRYLTNLKDAYQKKKGLRAILLKIKGITSPLERSTWLKELAIKAGLAENVLAEEMETLKLGESSSLPKTNLVVSKEETKLVRKDLIARRLLSLVYHNPEFGSLVKPLREFFPVVYHDVFDYFFTDKSSTIVIIPAAQKLIDVISLETGGTEEELNQLINQLKFEFYKHRQQVLRLLIAQAEKNNNEAALAQAMKEFDIISRERHNIITHGQEKDTQGEKEIAKEEDF